MQTTDGEKASAPDNKTCLTCGKRFSRPCFLQRHQKRKTPCDPILAGQEGAGGPPACRYCQRTFTTVTSMHRHIRQSCKIANTEEGMDKLFEHTLRRQLAAQDAKIDARMAAVQAENAEMKAQLTELTGMLKTQLVIAPARGVVNTVNIKGPVHVGPAVNIEIRPFDPGREILIPLELIQEALRESPVLREYVAMGDEARQDRKTAGRYVAGTLMDLIRRAHRDPVQRNIYINRKQANQLMAFRRPTPDAHGAWEVITFADGSQRLLAAADRELWREVRDCNKLGREEHTALCWVHLYYQEDPDGCEGIVKPEMAVHLENIRREVESG